MSVLVQEDHGATRILTLNRPRSRNALNTELLRALEDRFAAAEADDGIDVIILTGSDPAFCGGVDLRELEERGRAPEMGQPLAGVTKPVIGAVNGPAITGGLELALMCDLLIASELAVFADTHGRLGLLPGWGQMARLPNAVGYRRATELLLTSRTCDATEALEFGLVNAVVPHADTLPKALAIATAIGESDQPAVRAILAQLREGAGEQMAAALTRERERADLWQGQGFDTDLASRKRETL
jgi:enoyl-CoA hydratase